MRMRSYQFLTLLLLAVLLVSCHHQSVVPEAEATPGQQTAAESALSLAKRPFSPYLGDEWIGSAISYGCYRKGQAPGVKGPSEAEILEDLNILKENWNLIRVYGSDVDSERLLKVIHEHDLPFRVMLGAWMENETKRPERKPENLEQVTKAIELANRYKDIVIAVNVGNESQVSWSWHRMEADSLINYIRTVRTNIEQPVTTADDYNFWNKPESQQVANEIDFIALHAYPLWNGLTLNTTMHWADSVYLDIQSRHPDMTIALSEIGWATAYNPDRKGPGEQGSLIKAEVSIQAQEKFLIDLDHWTTKNKVTTFLFEAFDEPWKGGGDQSGPNEVEKHWGVFYEDRSPKASFTNYLESKNKGK